MKALLQRVTSASVSVDSRIIGNIGQGWLVLLGVHAHDTEADVKILTDKILNLRLFSDADGKFNLSALDIKAELLVISQFTLYADTRKGRRPSFQQAAAPDLARSLYETFLAAMRQSTLKVEAGRFGADMKVQLINDGPVTLMLDTDSKECASS